MERRCPRTALLPALVLAGAFLGGNVSASQPAISRCATADGSTAYTDGSCHALGGRPLPMSGELLRTLWREADLPPAPANRPVSTATDAGGVSCARNPAQLASTLRDSLAEANVNELAVVYDWSGMTSRQARGVLDRLQRISEQPLVDARYFGRPALDGGDNAGIVQLVQGAGAATVTELSVKRRAGCLFLAFH